MRAQSSKTELFDPYRAGYALGQELAALMPEVVFLYSSTHYAVPELLEGLYEALGSDEVIVIGNCGGGVYETTGVTDQGAVALGLNSDGKVCWKITSIENADQDLGSKLEAQFGTLEHDGQLPSIAYLAADFRIEAHTLENYMHTHFRFPVIGGLAADNLLTRPMAQRSSYLYVNRQIMNRAVVVLAAYGPVNFSITVGNSIHCVGTPASVDHAEGNRIYRIDGIPASQFIQRETGSYLLSSDVAFVLLKVSSPETPEAGRLCAVILGEVSPDESLRSIYRVPSGSRVQVALAEPPELLADVEVIADAQKAADKHPVAALIVSCTGRKRVLGKQTHHEVDALTARFPGLPLIGFPSHGEIAPLSLPTGYTGNHFHNMTYVLLLIEA